MLKKKDTVKATDTHSPQPQAAEKVKPHKAKKAKAPKAKKDQASKVEATPDNAMKIETAKMSKNELAKASSNLPGEVMQTTPMEPEKSAKQLRTMLNKTVVIGMIVFILLFVFVGTWSATAPLNSAAIAIGKVVLDANRKTIQHLEGGIIEDIRVKDGDTVESGQLLVALSKTKAQANWDILSGQLVVAQALEDRLLSERDGHEDIRFRESLLQRAASDESAKKNLDVQTRLFVSRKDTLVGQVGVLTQRIKQFEDEIKGLEAQRDAADKQLRLINEEVRSVEKLVKEGLAQKPRLLSLQREAARLLGSRGEFVARIARAGQSITENELSIINLRNETIGNVVAELRQVQTEIADLTERVGAAVDVLERTEIIAPRSGIVTGLQFHTKGGVVSPGQELMTIIPQDDELLLEAQVKPTDIDLVRPGLVSHVRLSAYKARTVPTLKGEVISVSPDSFVDEITGAPHYIARLRIYEESLKELDDTISLYPGMPAEVLIVTGSKTPLLYMLDPLLAFINKAGRED